MLPLALILVWRCVLEFLVCYHLLAITEDGAHVATSVILTLVSLRGSVISASTPGVLSFIQPGDFATGSGRLALVYGVRRVSRHASYRSLGAHIEVEDPPPRPLPLFH